MNMDIPSFEQLEGIRKNGVRLYPSRSGYSLTRPFKSNNLLLITQEFKLAGRSI